jgi:hypothetical protein
MHQRPVWGPGNTALFEFFCFIGQNQTTARPAQFCGCAGDKIINTGLGYSPAAPTVVTSARRYFVSANSGSASSQGSE